jgi:hypothetical protein
MYAQFPQYISKKSYILKLKEKSILLYDLAYGVLSQKNKKEKNSCRNQLIFSFHYPLEIFYVMERVHLFCFKSNAVSFYFLS